MVIWRTAVVESPLHQVLEEEAQDVDEISALDQIVPETFSDVDNYAPRERHPATAKTVSAWNELSHESIPEDAIVGETMPDPHSQQPIPKMAALSLIELVPRDPAAACGLARHLIHTMGLPWFKAVTGLQKLDCHTRPILSADAYAAMKVTIRPAWISVSASHPHP